MINIKENFKRIKHSNTVDDKQFNIEVFNFCHFNNRRLSETLRRPMNTLRRMRGQPGMAAAGARRGGARPARTPQRRTRPHKGYAPPLAYSARDMGDHILL